MMIDGDNRPVESGAKSQPEQLLRYVPEGRCENSLKARLDERLREAGFLSPFGC